MFEFKIDKKDKFARTAKFKTAHGDFSTPVFMPVGTKASVKAIQKEELDDIGAEIILNNTYHLYLRPGDEVIKKFGGVHKFQSYNKPILTDSGGFQVFSLGNTRQGESLVKIKEDGVFFRSFIDGSKHFFNAEKVMDIQSNLGADIIMAFDECAPGESEWAYAKSAMERTHRWAERCVKRWKENEKQRKKQGLYPQALFPIVQGVIYDDLRKKSAKFIGNLDTPGVAIGGLSVGESKKDMYKTLDIMKETLPENKPRYLMGVGTPEDLVEAIYRGVDMFDCVLPTRIGRHGTAFGSSGNIKIKNEKYKLSDEKLDKQCNCKVCKNYSKGYLRHLIQENEILGMQLISYHNINFLINLTKLSKEAINAGEFNSFKNGFLEQIKAC